MKGVVFTEFLEVVEDCFSPEIADRIIDASDWPSEGVYTAVGIYDHAEIVMLAQQLSVETKLGVDELLRRFGKHLFVRFVEASSHLDVRKPAPDAALPSLVATREDTNHLKIVDRSDRTRRDLAHGLIEGCIAQLAKPIEPRASHALAEAKHQTECALVCAA